MEQNKIIENPLTTMGYTQPSDTVPEWKSISKFIDGKLNTSEFVYKLNLSPIDERLNDQGKQLLDISNSSKKYTKHPVDTMFKPEWLNWYGINWTDITRFYKDNFTGRIHDDGNCNKWGINWVVSGYATVSFWNLSKIDSVITVNDEQNFPINVYSTSHPPCKHYMMPPGAYLFNAGLPHLPSGFNKRLVLSLRAKNMPWSQVVNHFSDLII